MALDSLISGFFGMAQDITNYSINENTNASNERNVNATNKANKEMTDATNAANLKIAQETNASNERIMQETNAFNAAQADLAYQRSTSAAKLGQLISAGLSPEQARQVIASQGLTGSPSAASGTAIPAVGATMQAPHNESFQKQPFQFQNLDDFGRGIGSFAKSFVDAANDPTGGTIGQLTCMKQFAKASDIIDEVDPKALSSNYAFFQWMKKQPPTSNWGKLVSTSDFQKMWNNPISRKAFMYNVNAWYGEASSIAFDLERKDLYNKLIIAQKHSTDLSSRLTNAQIFKTVSETNLIDAETNLTSEQTLGQKITNSRQAILLERDKQLKDLITETQKAQFSQELADSQLQLKLLQNPEYANAYWSSCIGNLAASTAMYGFTEWHYKKLQDGYNKVLDPDTEAVFLVLEDLGFQNSQTYDDMLKAILKDSNLTSYLMGKGWKGAPTLLPDGAIDGYTAYKTSLQQWSKDMEQMRYDAMRPFFKREDIKFGVNLGMDFINNGLTNGAQMVGSMMKLGRK